MVRTSIRIIGMSNGRELKMAGLPQAKAMPTGKVIPLRRGVVLAHQDRPHSTLNSGSAVIGVGCVTPDPSHLPSPLRPRNLNSGTLKSGWHKETHLQVAMGWHKTAIPCQGTVKPSHTSVKAQKLPLLTDIENVRTTMVKTSMLAIPPGFARVNIIVRGREEGTPETNLQGLAPEVAKRIPM